MSIQFNLSELLPNNIDPETVELRVLPAMNSTSWGFVNPPNEATVNDDGTIDVVLRGTRCSCSLASCPHRTFALRTFALSDDQTAILRCSGTPAVTLTTPTFRVGTSTA